MKSIFFVPDCVMLLWFLAFLWAFRSDCKRKIYDFAAVSLTLMLISVVYFGFRLWFMFFFW